MREKSEEYMESAQYLINNGKYTSSVHCSYYSRLLQMKYILANSESNPISLEAQNGKQAEGSHEYILKEICNRISNKGKAKTIIEFFRFLKRDRVDADYKDRMFSAEESLKAKETSESLKQKLNDQFGSLWKR